MAMDMREFDKAMDPLVSDSKAVFQCFDLKGKGVINILEVLLTAIFFSTNATLVCDRHPPIAIDLGWGWWQYYHPSIVKEGHQCDNALLWLVYRRKRWRPYLSYSTSTAPKGYPRWKWRS